MRILSNIMELNELLRGDDLSIFGAGNTAKQIIKYTSNSKKKISTIYVQLENNPVDILGIPVKKIDNISDDEARTTNLLVCVKNQWYEEVKSLIDNYPFRSVSYLSNELLNDVIYRNADFGIPALDAINSISNRINSISNRIDFQTDRILRFVSRPCLEYMIVNILDHCNLRCKGCDHFACIADEYFFPPEIIHRDLERMAEIFCGDYIMKIAVMGGEPLLHPNLNEILADVRHFFPHTIIRLTTNGLLLLKQDENFWRTCRENNVTIVNTKYPINLDFDAMQKKALTEGVKFQFFEGTGEDRARYSFKKIINMSGDSNPVDSFSRCHISNYGNILLDGKFYGCPFSVQSYRIFNKKFGQNLRMTEDDYLDIYKVNNKEEFFKFAARPKFYCRYCKGISSEFPWSRSKQEMSEWVE